MRRVLTFVLSLLFTLWFAGCGSSSHSNSTTTSGTGVSTNSGTGGSGGSGSGSSQTYVSYAFTTTQSSLIAYGVQADGSLVQLPNSPYSVGSSYIVTNGSHVYLTDTNNQNIVTYGLDKSSGGLAYVNTTTAIAGDPNTSDYAVGLSLDHTGGSLYVPVNLSDIDSGINVFNVSGASPAQVQYTQLGAYAVSAPVFSPDNRYGYSYNCGARSGWTIHLLVRAADGTLTASDPGPGARGPAVAAPSTAYCPGPLAVSAAGYLAVAYTPFPYGSGVTVGNQVYITTYKINSDGTLTPVANSQANTASTSGQQSQNYVLSFDPTGSYLAFAGDGGVQTYQLQSSGQLAAIGAAVDAGMSFQTIAWDKSNHVFATTASQLFVFNSNNGALTAANGSPYPGGAGLTALPLQ